MRAPLDQARLTEALVAQGPYAGVEVAQTIDSTNAELARRAATASPPPHLTALLAEHQTAGRGRLHPGEPDPRQWLAPPRTSLIASILFRPPATLAAPKTLLGLAVALAAVQALDLVLPGQAGLKWPNDVTVDGRKLAGVLAAATPTGDVVVGIGLNVHQTEAELPELRATSLALVGAPDVDRTWLAIAVLSAAATNYERWTRGGRELWSGIVQRMRTLGEQVEVRLPDGSVVEGLAEALEPDGALRLVRADGTFRRVDGGDLLEGSGRGGMTGAHGL
ncbi:MAG: biotin--[acetyl-CoA-carboxylase] ligase [Bifidobacteriaceae bacterium]|jgi:BirA family biotin operon repressor/biotin-[acetyl-CoA-carboxylase] ligase|nr:biotin--[acetyl-CoA-carboxylase] ligase [Bifidobacteriaceae bacterium]